MKRRSRTVSLKAQFSCANCGHNDLTHALANMSNAMSDDGKKPIACIAGGCTCPGYRMGPVVRV